MNEVAAEMRQSMMGFLLEFSAQLKGKFRLSEVAEAIVSKTMQLFDAEGASILVWDETRQNLRFAAHRSQDEVVDERLRELRVPVGRGIAGWVAAHARPVVVHDVQKDARFHRETDQETSFTTRDLIAAPITIEEDLIGVIEVVNRRQTPFQEADIPFLELIASIVAVFVEKAQLTAAQIALAQVEKELDIAHDLIHQLMPDLPVNLEPYRLFGDMSASSRVGGDFWDVIDMDNGERLIALGDVSGHGLKAALVMSAIRTVLRATCQQGRTPLETVRILNELIYTEFGRNGQYATFIFCHVRKSGLEVLRAGHVQPVLCRHDEWVQLDWPAALPVGLLPQRPADPWRPFAMEPGDRLFLVTDGIEDGFSHDGFDLAGFLAHQADLENRVLERRFFGDLIRDAGWRNDDDATLLCLTRRS